LIDGHAGAGINHGELDFVGELTDTNQYRGSRRRMSDRVVNQVIDDLFWGIRQRGTEGMLGTFIGNGDLALFGKRPPIFYPVKSQNCEINRQNIMRTALRPGNREQSLDDRRQSLDLDLGVTESLFRGHGIDEKCGAGTLDA